MNLSVQRAIDRIIGTVICKLFSVLPQRSKTAAGEQKPQTILIILLSEMGSWVLARPMFMRLKSKYPDASIHVLLFEKNREILDILDVMPEQNVLTIKEDSLGRFALDIFRAVVSMRRLKIDTVIDCELFARVSSILSFLSGASRRAGFYPYTQEGLYRGSFINCPVMYNPYQHISHQFVNLVDSLDSKTWPVGKRLVRESIDRIPQVVLDPDEVDAISQQLKQDFPVCASKKLILIYPSGGILPIRAWPVEQYGKLVKAFIEDGYVVGIIGVPNDKPLADKLTAQINNDPSLIDLTGYTRSIKELLILFHVATLLVTNDGGPGQFAALTPIPTIIFFGPETPKLYGSLSNNAFFFYLSYSCSPCLTAYNHRNSPCDGDNQCLRQIGSDQVYAKAQEMLAASSTNT